MAKRYSNNPKDWGFYIVNNEVGSDVDYILLSPKNNGKLCDRLGAHNLPLEIKKLLSKNYVNVEGELMESAFEFITEVVDREFFVESLIEAGFNEDKRLYLGREVDDYGNKILETKVINSEDIDKLEMDVNCYGVTIYFNFGTDKDIVIIYNARQKDWEKDPSIVAEMLRNIGSFNTYKPTLFRDLGYTIL